VVDLAGTQAAANPIGLSLAGLPAKAVARGYHLLALPGNRTRTAADWLLAAALSRQVVQLGLVAPAAVRLDSTAK
jgi:NADH dehydrogenase